MVITYVQFRKKKKEKMAALFWLDPVLTYFQFRQAPALFRFSSEIPQSLRAIASPRRKLKGARPKWIRYQGTGSCRPREWPPNFSIFSQVCNLLKSDGLKFEEALRQQERAVAKTTGACCFFLFVQCFCFFFVDVSFCFFPFFWRVPWISTKRSFGGLVSLWRRWSNNCQRVIHVTRCCFSCFFSMMTLASSYGARDCPIA